MDKIPFSVYDFFGYLSAGAVVLFASAFAYQGTEAFNLDLSAAQVLGLIVAAYIAGHVIAAISGFLLERRLTRKIIGSPTSLLFSNDSPKNWRRLLSAYHSSLPEKMAKQVLAKAKDSAGIEEPGEALFFHCFTVVRHDEYPRERLATFLNLYGFSRNVSMASLAAAVIIGVAALINDQIAASELWTGAGLGLLVSVVMYFRYLKFYRQYSVELYVTYAGMDS